MQGFFKRQVVSHGGYLTQIEKIDGNKVTLDTGVVCSPEEIEPASHEDTKFYLANSR